jgi:ribonuclease G
MAGIRAAFIDLNTPKDAFLHFSDLGEHLEDYIVMLNGKDAFKKDDKKRLDDYRKQRESKGDTNGGNPKTGMTADEQNLMGNLMQVGQKLLVQIVKEPIGSKGPRVSTNISLAGRFLVLMPMGDYIAVSKRIKSYKERRNLRQLVQNIVPDGFGVIVRTVAEGVDEALIETDLRDLLAKWNNLVAQLETAKPPMLVHRDLEMTESLIRDLFAKDYDRILVDDKKMFQTLKTYVGKIAPNMLPNIELYQRSEHIFDHMKIHSDVESIFSPRVKMPSGGYLIFEQTEAMYVVDVNSGRYAAKKVQEDNSLKTNLEAAREIAKQLRLRDIGGIIVVDFIDLKEDSNRKKVYDELRKEFKKDRAKTNLLPMSDFGLIQITRQRIRPSVVNSVSRVCPMCGGGGNIVSHNTILSDLEGWLNKFRHTTKFWAVDLHLNPYMKGMLTKGVFSQQLKWMFKYRLRLNIIDDQTLSMNDYRFALTGSDVDITEPIMLNQSIDDAIKVYNLRLAEMESEDQRDISKLDIYKKEEEAPAPTPAKPERRVIQMPTPAPKPAAQAPAPAQAKPQPKPAPAPKPVAAKPEPKPQPAPQPKAEVKSEPKPEKQPDPALANLPQAIDVARAYKAAKDSGTAYVAPLPAPVAAPAPVPVPAAEVVTEEPAVAIAQPSEETKAAVAAVITKVVAAKKKPAPKKKAEDATEAESDMATDEPAKPKVQRRPATKPKVTPKKRGSDDDMPVDPDELA